MDFRLLGPLEATVDGRQLPLAGRKQRALLARLLLDFNRTVSTDRLVDDLWGDDVPDTAQKMVQIYVSQLRKVLPDGVLRTRAPGYALEVDPDGLDLVQFERLRTAAQAALAEGDSVRAAAGFREALGLWRGVALAEFTEPFARSETGRLEELHLTCLESRIEADLAAGRHADLVGELEVLVARHPLREGLRAQQMLALYRSGRHSEALAAYHTFRATLTDELGLEPSTRLKELERRMLQQDPGLDLPVAPTAVVPPVSAPEVRYVTSGDVSIAYQVVGDGPLDLVLVHGWVCSFEPGWERPQIASFYRRLAGMGRLIHFDKRGMGLSDRVAGIAGLEERMDDVRAVLDAVQSRRAVLLGISEGGAMVSLFAATYPERTAGIVLMGTYARRYWAPDYRIGKPLADAWWKNPNPEEWGLPTARRFVDDVAPSVSGDEEVYRWYASYLVRGASPGAAAQFSRMNAEIDVRHVLPTVHVPALLLYREGESLAAATRDMGERIPGARVRGLPGDDHLPWEGEQEDVLGEIERFLGELDGELDGEPEADRVLATVLFVEADGTKEACDLVRLQVARFRGAEVSLTDDTLVATFDGPARAIRCAGALFDVAHCSGRPPRAGLHTGECEVVGGSLTGIPIELARGMKDLAEPGEVLVSSTVRDLVAGSGIEFSERGLGPLQLTGLEGQWRLYSVARP